MISTSGHLIPKFPEVRFHRTRIFNYLTYLLEKLPDDRMIDDELELLAPWNETVKAEIEHRANESNQTYVNCEGAPTTEK